MGQEEQLKLKRENSKQAIALALQGQWEEAIAVNKAIVESSPTDVDAYNRLGRAYMETGDYKHAKEAYSRTLQIDAYNTIAKKNLERLAYAREGGKTKVAHKVGVKPQQFIEEVGKAGTVALTQIASREILAALVAGDAVKLKVDNGHLVVQNSQGNNIGVVDPRHGQRLVRLMKGGNRYAAVVSSSTSNAVSVLIREEFQHPTQKGLVSFPPKPVRVQNFVQSKSTSREEELEEADDEERENDDEPREREGNGEERLGEGFAIENGDSNGDD